MENIKLCGLVWEDTAIPDELGDGTEYVSYCTHSKYTSWCIESDLNGEWSVYALLNYDPYWKAYKELVHCKTLTSAKRWVTRYMEKVEYKYFRRFEEE